MIVRCFWPSCDFRQKEWDSSPIDAFWVEATHEEALQSVFPMLSQELQVESEQFEARGENLEETDSQPPRLFCFLVARDFSSIDPFEVHYHSIIYGMHIHLFAQFPNGRSHRFKNWLGFRSKSIADVGVRAGLPAASPQFIPT